MLHACHRFGNSRKPAHFAYFWQGAQSPAPATQKRHLNAQKCSEPVSFLHFWLRNVLCATTAYTFSTCQLPKKWSMHVVLCTFWLGNGLRATAAHTFSISQLRARQFLTLLTLKCASRHNGAHFFGISTQLPKVLRMWVALSFFTCKCASRHNGVHFLIPHLATWLCTRRFIEPTFRPSGATNHWKNTVNHDFSTFCALASSVSLPWSSFFFSSHLCFSSVHMVESSTSKLPSMITEP